MPQQAVTVSSLLAAAALMGAPSQQERRGRSRSPGRRGRGSRSPSPAARQGAAGATTANAALAALLPNLLDSQLLLTPQRRRNRSRSPGRSRSPSGRLATRAADTPCRYGSTCTSGSRWCQFSHSHMRDCPNGAACHDVGCAWVHPPVAVSTSGDCPNVAVSTSAL